MLVGIIKENNDNYYINLDNNKAISIIKSNKNKTKCLTEEEAIYLLEILLSSSLTFKETKDKYDIYLDESNNKRYFKNNREDFKMFFNNNGINYIKYKSEEEITNEIKRLKVKVGNRLFILLIGSILLLNIPDIRYKIIDTFYKEEIALEDTENLILESTYLTDEEKNYLYNGELLKDVIDISDNNRNYSLREKLSNIEIKTYKEDERPNTTGYYNSLEPNVLYIRDDINKTDRKNYYGTLSHEFVHLLQNESDYLYIHEATAELISYEYYNDIIDSYSEEIKRLKVLMEIIGPKPILECNFKNTDESLEEAIKKYLVEEDANELLELFKTNGEEFRDEEKEKVLNAKIDKLLSTMYYNKYQKDIKDDELINLIYQNNCTVERCYFNKTRDEFSKKLELEPKRIDLDSVLLEDVIDTDEVEKYNYYDYKVCTEEEYKNLTMNEITYYNTINTSYKPTQNVTISLSDENKILYVVDGTKYNQEDALANGYIEKIITLTKGIEVNSFSDIELDKCSRLKIYFKDGSIGETTHNKEMNTWGSVIKYKYEPEVIIPSIKEKFSDQFDNESSKNIEILDLYDEEVSNNKSEVKLI